jgi:predicted KAP-like P-loop ATPase
MKWISKILRRSENAHAQRQGTTYNKDAARITADNPIRRPEDDALGRTNAARSFAAQVLSLDVTEGVVVGVLGPWGSGKTSFVNLTRAYLESARVAVLDFNPWMFSGAEQLRRFWRRSSSAGKTELVLAESRLKKHFARLRSRW